MPSGECLKVLNKTEAVSFVSNSSLKTEVSPTSSTQAQCPVAPGMLGSTAPTPLPQGTAAQTEKVGTGNDIMPVVPHGIRWTLEKCPVS